MSRRAVVLRRVLNFALAGVALSFVGGGIAAAHANASQNAERARYVAAPECPGGVPTTANPPSCWVRLDATLLGRITDNHIGFRSPLMVVRMGDGTVRSIRVLPSKVYDGVPPGDQVQVKMWGSTATTIYTNRGAIPTPANPTVADSLPVVGGTSLIAVGSALLLLIPWRIPRLRAQPLGGPMPAHNAASSSASS